MKNKFFLQLTILLCLSSGATYAVSTSSLWGTIDEPVPPVKQIEQQQEVVQVEQQKVDNEKTICELLTAQPTLSMDKDNAAKIQDALQRAYRTSQPDYKMLMVNADAANNLYAKYRDLYMSTYCLAAVPAQPQTQPQAPTPAVTVKQ